jgi:hypothetical protein
MNLSNRCQRGVTVLGGLSLAVVLSGLTASAAAATDEVNVSAASTRAKVERQRYHVYDSYPTRIGLWWRYLGSYDDPDAAAAAARAARAARGDHWPVQVVAGKRLALPRELGTESGGVYYYHDLYYAVSAESGGAIAYRTAAEATAAAERIVAEGKRFEVMYDEYGYFAAAAEANKAAAKTDEAAERALRQYHVYGRVGCRLPRMRLLGSYDRAEEAFKAAEKHKTDATELTVVTGASGELPPSGRPCTFEVYSVNRKCGQYNLAGAYATLPEAVEQALKIQKEESYQGFGIAYNYNNRGK